MKKLFVFSDVHSFYDEFIDALNKSGFDIDNEDHILISCGDLCDRGPKSKEILNYINKIADNRKICIIGNHELLMEELINKGEALSHDFTNGTTKTVEQLTDIYNELSSALKEMKDNKIWKKYKKSWRWFFEVGDYIFVHGWIPCMINRRFSNSSYEYIENWRNCKAYEFQEATWVNGMRAWNDGVREINKTIFCGHWHSSWGHSVLHHEGDEFYNKDKPNSYAKFSPFIDEGIIALDGCTAYSKIVNIYTLEIEDDIWLEAIK